MRHLLKPFQLLYVIYAFACFVILMIPVFLWSIAVAQGGRIKGGNLVYMACVVWADLWFALVLIPHRNIYRQKPASDQSFIYVANHTSYLDAAIIPKVFRRPVRPLGKVEMARVPIFGQIYKNAIVTVDRTSTVNRAKSVQELKSILSHGISILVFPEGTFNETGQPLKEFYDGAFRIAIETGTAIVPVLLLDMYSRMHPKSVFSLNPGRSRAVFLPEIAAAGLTLKDLPELKCKVYEAMEAGLRQEGAAWIN